MERVRQLFVAGSLALSALAALFFFRLPPATSIWPWPDTPLSFIFLASILAAIAAPLLWIGISREFGASRAGALNLFVTFGGWCVYFILLHAQRGETQLLVWALVCAGFTLANVVVWFWARTIPLRDRRPTPRPVRASFVVFALVLIPVGTALVMRQPHVFPWPLNPDSSVLFGLIFLGAAVYFIHAVAWPSWANAKGQLAGFLAYDLVLIWPYLRHFGTVKPEHRTSLIVYVAIIVFSGVLAVYYLFIYRHTRGRAAAN
jgi:hypothetical protein